ncbi:MAG: class I SAM-dependent methyltransferase [Alphaproteobacteria bacterium]
MPNDPRNADASPGANADQIAYWNGDAGMRWRAQQERLDALFAPLTAAVMDFAAPAKGERVLDIGCGCGATLLALAPRVGPEGKLLGVDISQAMLERAAERLRAGPWQNADVLLTDASSHPFEAGAFNLAFSRFGVMFFDDFAKAFANIQHSLAEGGRLAFVCWRPMAENPWFLAPLAAARPYLPPQEPADPDAPGPFALANPERIRGILASGGFSAIEIARHDTELRIAGSNELALATDFAVQFGPTARALAAAEPAARAAAEAAIREDLARRARPEGIIFPGSVWLVSARA